MKGFNLDTLVRPSIRALKPYSSARDEFKEFDKDMVFLDANENPYNTGLNRYPDPHQIALKQRFSTLKEIPLDNMLLGNGSDEVLDLLVRAFCEPNQDHVLTCPPTYGMYTVLGNLNNVGVKEIPLIKDFQLNVSSILDQINEQSKILFLCSPNNPSGNSLNINDIETLLRQFNGIVVIDEAYIDFSSQVSWIEKLEEFPNLVVTQTLSKAYGLAGIRLGICYASQDIVKILNNIKPPYNINELTQREALKALKDTSSVTEQIQLIIEERHQLNSMLKSVSFIEKVYPSEANFLLVKVDNATKRYHQLLEKGIVVRNRTTQHGCENCLRITVGTPQENSNLINALKELE